MAALIAMPAALASLPGPATAADTAYGRHLRHAPAPVRVVVSPGYGCGPDWPCGPWEYHWPQRCWQQNFPDPVCARILAWHDDEHCRYFGPPGSPVYAQCRANRYHEHISLPLRVVK